MCLWKGSDLMREVFLKGFNLVYGSGDYYRKDIVSHLLAVYLKSFQTDGVFYIQKILKVIYFFDEKWPLLSLYTFLDPMSLRFSSELMEWICFTLGPGRRLF